MTNYIRGQGKKGSPIRHEEKLREKIVATAREKFDAEYQIPLQIHFHWYGRVPLASTKKAIMEKLIRDTSELVGAHIPQQIYASEYIDEYGLEGTSADDFIARISITRLKPNAKSVWSSTEVGFPAVYAEELQGLISLKEETFDLYLQKCNAVWLVVVADAKHISSIAEIEEEVSQYNFETRFERILFYNHVNQKVIVLSDNISE